MRASPQQLRAVALAIVAVSGVVVPTVALAGGPATGQAGADVRVEGGTDVDGDGLVGADETNDGDAVYGSIGAGVENASDGDRVVVAAGNYLENDVTVSERIRLVADGTVTVDGNGLFGPGIVIEAGAAGTVVEGFVLTSHRDGIRVRADNVTLDGVTARLNNNDGVEVESTTDVTLAGVRLESNDGAGLNAQDVGTVAVRDATVTGNGPGLNVQGTVSTVRISATTVENSAGADGVFVAGADTVRVNDTTLRNSGQAGIDTRDAETVRLTDVRSVENGGKGLRVTGSDAFGRSVRLRNVSVESNDGEGLRVEGTGGDDEVVVRASTILASGNQGIDTDGPETVTVTNVTLRGNGDDAIEASSSAGLSLTVRNATIDTTGTAAVRAVDATSVLVSDARFENVDDTGVVVTGSNVAGRTVEVSDLSVDGAGGDGVRLRGTAGDDAATVRNVTVLGAGDSGVEVQDTETVTVRNATVTGGNDGAVELRGGSGYSATVVDLSVDNSQHAVDARNPTGITVRNVRSRDTGGDAVRITGTGVASRTATVRNVTARTADDGVYVRGAGTGDRATVEGVNVSGLTRRGVFLRDIDRANVSNLTVSGAGSTGVRFRGGDRVGLRDARLGVGSDAVFASDVGTLRVSNVTVTDGGGEAAIDADAVATLLVEHFAAAPVGGNGISVTQGDVSGRTVRLRDVSLDATGGFGVELRGTSVDDTAVVANATVSGSGGEAGILIDGFETPQLRNVTVTGTTGSFGSGDGIRVADAAGGVLASGTVDDNAGAGVQLNGVDSFTVRNSTLTNNTNGVFLTRGATPEGVEINGNVIAGNDNRGVENNEPGVVDARSNYWGASDGPSSPDDFDAPFEDPVTGTLADGSGDAVSEGSSGVADVRFDPFLSAAPGVEGPPPIPGGTGRPTDPDGDGAYEDVNGDGNVDVLDVALLLDALDSSEVRSNVGAFDFNDDGQINILDVAALLDRT